MNPDSFTKDISNHVTVSNLAKEILLKAYPNGMVLTEKGAQENIVKFAFEIADSFVKEVNRRTLEIIEKHGYNESSMVSNPFDGMFGKN